jgi:hypothetical protein
MPLPPELSKKAPRKKKRARAKAVMHELKKGPVRSPSRKAAARNGTSDKQDVAIMLKNSGQSRDDGSKKTRKGARHRRTKSRRTSRQ